MKKTMAQFISGVLTLALALVSVHNVSASPQASPLQVSTAYYVSPTGNDANAGTINAPLKSIQAAANKTSAGDTIILLAGSYTGVSTVTEVGTSESPVIIRGEGAVFNGGTLILKNSQWLILENLTFIGGENQVTLQNSHFLAFRKNIFDFQTRGIYIQDYSSHILVENNEFYQSCATGKTWTQLKGSTCEGGAVYGSSYGGGTYHIRNNWVHDSFNGFIFSDDTTGQWMNANVFIYDNHFERIVDDPAEPEGDSFNFHVYNNTMIDTHRMVSLTTKGLGPVFVYNNVQITSGNPTNESTRLNSAFKVDLSKGYTNGVYIFNNTIVGENAANFYAFDMLSRTVATPLTIRNNVYVTALKAFNKTPNGGSINYDISKAAFGMTQPNGIVGDPLVQSNGALSENSMAASKSTLVSIPTYFSASEVVPAGADLGAHQAMPAPAWVTPPSYPASKIPAVVNNWIGILSTFDTQPVDKETASPTPTETASPTPTESTPTAEPVTPTPETTPVVTETSAPTETESPTPVVTETPAPTETAPVTETTEPTETAPAETETPSSNEVIYDNTDSAFVYSPEWTDEVKKAAHGGSFKLTTENNASVEFTFTGSSFSVLYAGGSAFRSMDVYVDGVLVGSINQKTDSRTYGLRWDSGQLEQGEHTLRLVFVTTNTKSKTKGTLDAVIVR